MSTQQQFYSAYDSSAADGLMLIDLQLTGGPPWGFRLKTSGGGTSLIVRRVRRRSPAQLAGLMEGDQLVSLNGASLTGRSHAFTVQLMDRQRRLALRVKRSQRPIIGRSAMRDSSMSFRLLDDDEETVSEVTLDGLAGDESLANDSSWATWLQADAELPLPEELPVPELQLNSSNDARDDAESTQDLLDFPSGASAIPFSKLIREPPRQSAAKSFAKPRYEDSAYAGTPGYPTAEERKRMARRMARSLTDPVNRGCRGANMFEGRRQRADKFTVESFGGNGGGWSSSGIDPTMSGAMIDTSVGGPVGDARDDWGITRVPLPPKPLTTSWSFFDGQQQPKTVAEFVERELISAPKLTHRDYDPAKAFNLAAALRAGGGKAGQMFEKRRHRANKFTVEGLGRATDFAEPIGNVGGSGADGGISEL